VQAGRMARLAGLGVEREAAEASSPLTGFLDAPASAQPDQTVVSP
jgi:thiazole synthase ThiGH ThiG subunit